MKQKMEYVFLIVDEFDMAEYRRKHCLKAVKLNLMEEA
jgi:hypothetical protein